MCLTLVLLGPSCTDRYTTAYKTDQPVDGLHRPAPLTWQQWSLALADAAAPQCVLAPASQQPPFRQPPSPSHCAHCLWPFASAWACAHARGAPSHASPPTLIPTGQSACISSTRAGLVYTPFGQVAVFLSSHLGCWLHLKCVQTETRMARKYNACLSAAAGTNTHPWKKACMQPRIWTMRFPGQVNTWATTLQLC